MCSGRRRLTRPFHVTGVQTWARPVSDAAMVGADAAMVGGARRKGLRRSARARPSAGSWSGRRRGRRGVRGGPTGRCRGGSGESRPQGRRLGVGPGSHCVRCQQAARHEAENQGGRQAGGPTSRIPDRAGHGPGMVVGCLFPNRDVANRLRIAAILWCTSFSLFPAVPVRVSGNRVRLPTKGVPIQ